MPDLSASHEAASPSTWAPSGRSWSQRTFSKVQAGSVRGSIFSLCCSAIGMGVLLLPYTMAQVGPLLALVLLFVAGLAAYSSLRICCAGMQATNSHSYVDTLIALFSDRVAMVLTSMLVVACFGLCCGYMVFSSQLLQQLLEVAGVRCQRGTIVLVTACLPVFPLSLFRNLSDFRYLTLVSLVGLTYLTILVVIRTPNYIGNNGLGHDWLWRVHDISAFPKCLSLCFTAYTVHMNVFACYDELQNPSRNRIVKVLFRSTMVQSTLYISIAICGFLSFGVNTPDNILMAYSLHDVLGNIGRGFVSFQLLLAVPLTVHPARTYLWPLVRPCCRRHAVARPASPVAITGSGGVRLVPVNGGASPSVTEIEEQENSMGGIAESADGMSRTVHITMTAVLISLAALVSSCVDSASDLLGIVGGFAAVTYAYLLPAEMAQRLRRSGVTNNIDWTNSPASFVAGRFGLLVIWGLRACSVLGYIAAAQCASNMIQGK